MINYVEQSSEKQVSHWTIRCNIRDKITRLPPRTLVVPVPIVILHHPRTYILQCCLPAHRLDSSVTELSVCKLRFWGHDLWLWYGQV